MDKFAIFEKMTKRQIINWIRNNMWSHHRLPKESDLLWSQYEELSDRALREGEAHLKRGKEINETGWAEKYDKLAAQFNESKDIQERIKLIDQMSKLREPWDKHIEDYKRVDKLHEDAEKIHKKCVEKRKQEANNE